MSTEPQPTADDIRANVTEWAASIGLTMTAAFVPKSASRNAAEKAKSLNWIVAFKRDSRTLATDYMQGIGHVPGYPHSLGSETLDRREHRKECERAAEAGTYPVQKFSALGYWKRAPLNPPHMAEVLSSLALDASVLDSSGFEDWASELGYETDSRKAEAIYRACIEIALQLRALIGQDGIEKLRDLTRDF